jgi:hypothetical protein
MYVQQSLSVQSCWQSEEKSQVLFKIGANPRRALKMALLSGK